MFVNDINLENGSLEEAVQALKGAPTGTVKIGVAKPLPVRIWEFYGYFSCHLSWYTMILTSAYCVLWVQLGGSKHLSLTDSCISLYIGVACAVCDWCGDCRT